MLRNSKISDVKLKDNLFIIRRGLITELFIEKTNGLLHQYLPKGGDSSVYTQEPMYVIARSE